MAAGNHNLYKGPEFKIVDEKVVRYSDVCVHEFSLADVEDPELYAAEPIWKWQQSEAGQWVMENAVETPYWMSNRNYTTWGQQYKIVARLSEQNETFWRLKWGGLNK